MLEWIKSNWVLIAAFFTASVAWGQQQLKVQSLEDAVKSQASIQHEVVELQKQNARVDERTSAIVKNQETQQRLLEMLLENQRTLIRQKK